VPKGWKKEFAQHYSESPCILALGV